MGTKHVSLISKRTLTPRVTSLPTGSYTLLRKEEKEETINSRPLTVVGDDSDCVHLLFPVKRCLIDNVSMT